MKTIKVLAVCLGNICRSPAAQGILEYAAMARKGIELEVDSAGTAAYHIGSQPDSRSIAELKKRSIDISNQRARQVAREDFEYFDWILAMDESNYQNLIRICPEKCKSKVVLFGALPDRKVLGAVKDPYYDGNDAFKVMADHLIDLSDNFLDFIHASSK
ncbi:low molecular weight phosphotyrosine protein phosphatase [Marinomonas sp. 15G1-11]|uniref:protein-tyrosine-phosphatase n=1 Tax=Marinomonas phaeophyticola TaxID=3004091 RepID=A0ABT4JPS4_9GAMM|nr:low molecular weight protein-tyrosine-phosphatase [Marinomonas sp. 15G1-11]MCZ2720225.1 low molecular weight phosphotyrosine protein phosphatase [Marinomonas sp. 15G1-11]